VANFRNRPNPGVIPFTGQFQGYSLATIQHLIAGHPNPIVRSSRLTENAGRKGLWEIHYYDPERRRTSTGTTDKDQAVVFYSRWLDDQNRGAALIVPTVRDICELYIARKPKQRYSVRAIVEYFGDVPIDAINDDIDDLLQAANPSLQRGSRRKYLAHLKAALNSAKKEGRIGKVPVFDLPADSPPRTRSLTEQQEQLVWDKALALPPEKEYLKLFLTIALETGARKGAIQELTWDRVDLENEQIDFVDKQNRPDWERNKKRRVYAPITEKLLPVLQAAALTAEKDSFGHPTGRVVKIVQVQHGFNQFAAALGLRWFTPHVCRHTFVTLRIRAGCNVFHVAKLVGDNLATIEKTYAHLFVEDLRASANRRRS